MLRQSVVNPRMLVAIGSLLAGVPATLADPVKGTLTAFGRPHIPLGAGCLTGQTNPDGSTCLLVDTGSANKMGQATDGVSVEVKDEALPDGFAIDLEDLCLDLLDQQFVFGVGGIYRPDPDPNPNDTSRFFSGILFKNFFGTGTYHVIPIFNAAAEPGDAPIFESQIEVKCINVAEAAPPFLATDTLIAGSISSNAKLARLDVGILPESNQLKVTIWFSEPATFTRTGGDAARVQGPHLHRHAFRRLRPREDDQR